MTRGRRGALALCRVGRKCLGVPLRGLLKAHKVKNKESGLAGGKAETPLENKHVSCPFTGRCREGMWSEDRLERQNNSMKQRRSRSGFRTAEVPEVEPTSTSGTHLADRSHRTALAKH